MLVAASHLTRIERSSSLISISAKCILTMTRWNYTHGPIPSRRFRRPLYLVRRVNPHRHEQHGIISYGLMGCFCWIDKPAFPKQTTELSFIYRCRWILFVLFQKSSFGAIQYTNVYIILHAYQTLGLHSGPTSIRTLRYTWSINGSLT